MRIVLFALFLSLAACVRPAAEVAPVDDRLYRDLGQQVGITRIVEGMLLNVAKDPRIVAYFRNVDIVRLRDLLVEKICVEAGGPCGYSGATMEEAHKGQQITRGHFNALVENLQASMTAEQVPIPVQNRLLARLASMRGEVIEH